MNTAYSSRPSPRILSTHALRFEFMTTPMTFEIRLLNGERARARRARVVSRPGQADRRARQVPRCRQEGASPHARSQRCPRCPRALLRPRRHTIQRGDNPGRADPRGVAPGCRSPDRPCSRAGCGPPGPVHHEQPGGPVSAPRARLGRLHRAASRVRNRTAVRRRCGSLSAGCAGGRPVICEAD